MALQRGGSQARHGRFGEALQQSLPRVSLLTPELLANVNKRWLLWHHGAVMNSHWIKATVLLIPACIPCLAGGPSEEILFRKHDIDQGRNESCTVADLNNDGFLDIISGENWFRGPDYQRNKFRSLLFWNNYIDDFSDLALDVDSDGYLDIASVGWGSRTITWWRNPGRAIGIWKKQLVHEGLPVEFALLVDLNGDGLTREVLPQFGSNEADKTAWYEPSEDGHSWVEHVVHVEADGHGIGAGDVNGDGHIDVLTPKGWYEAPRNPRNTPWTPHAEFQIKKNAGFLHVADIDNDGLNDIVTSYAHSYGIFWLKQGKGANGERTWEQLLIDDSWSQAHATTLADLTGNGQLEIVTGKRLYAHNGHDDGGREPLGLYWYEYVETERGHEWVRHIIHYGGRVGGGMQIPVMDMDKDGDMDIVVAGKSGVFLFENLTR